MSNQVQYKITYIPENATDKEVIWSVENITGRAEIDQQGLLTPYELGEIKVMATLKSNPLINNYLEVLIKEKGLILRAKDGRTLRDKNLEILVMALQNKEG